MAERTNDQVPPITIKKYANRRLYNKATSTYVTLDHLAQMVKEGVDFVVYDAKSGDDITRSVLTQIIVEEESKGQNLLPTSFLRNLISFYGDSLQGLVPRYLEHSMQSFSHNQDQIRNYVKETMDGLFPFNHFEEMGKQNMAFFENAMKMFAPLQGAPGDPKAGAKMNAAEQKGGEDAELDTLLNRLHEMERQIERLSTDRKKTSD
ncbi:MAG: polyhydroxyalkanoate synthesis repressor PhaR [Rhodospirillales bacterium]|nr:polyhydroxyalkanoate synthesis repressor PhaR [Rhodospirillales bacterium]MCW8861176.1 polyhydroxyalkanoate synthesis repressor PhaR [Rhodospirillales bacterium]MCW8951161.1 polyhydroxyalkanoate synthesis repressor PhaR [Rhodospirillales bacterium]MCW8970963.1 polyhydroxyalkanoate synthesis repressor PhaR [Rhodospirillales bacterium]MCW9002647.1 polyhydroxyalkanoate synthesis repressor PhaR [Rhodospirillales bacterium]